MSWAEVKKINSDMREPLNYVHYINDISVFGNESFVMSPENAALWSEFCLKSLWLYGHRQIHEYVYNRFDNENIDDLWKDSGILGQQLNSFYGNKNFPDGNGLIVVQQMTTDLFNILESKIQEGYSRFVETFLSKDAVGQWLTDTFELSSTVLPALKTIDEIIANNEAMSDLCNSVQALIALTNCKYSADKIAASESASELIVQNSLSTLTIHALINNASFMEAAVQKQNVMQIIANSESAMYSAIRSSIAMSAILNSEVAMEEMSNSEVAVNTFLVAIDDLSKGTQALQTIQGDITSIQAQLPNIIEGNTAEQNVKLAKDTVQSVLTTLDPILGKMAVVKSTIDKFVNSSTAMNAIAASSTAMNAIAASSTARTVCINSSVAMNVIGSSDLAVSKFAAGCAGLNPQSYSSMSTIAASSTAMNAIAASSTARTACINSSVAMNVIGSSDLAVSKFAAGCAGLNPQSYSSMNTIAASNTAMNSIAASSTAMSTIAASNTALDALYARKTRIQGGHTYRSGKMIILEISSGNAWDTSKYGYAQLSDGSEPNWYSYKSKFAFFKKYPLYATYIRNDTESNDWIDYFKIQ